MSSEDNYTLYLLDEEELQAIVNVRTKELQIHIDKLEWNNNELKDENAELKQRTVEMQERLRWKPLSELPEENREVLAKTKTNVILIIETQQIEEFNYDEQEHFGYGLIEYFMELPEVK